MDSFSADFDRYDSANMFLQFDTMNGSAQQGDGDGNTTFDAAVIDFMSSTGQTGKSVFDSIGRGQAQSKPSNHHPSSVPSLNLSSDNIGKQNNSSAFSRDFLRMGSLNVDLGSIDEMSDDMFTPSNASSFDDVFVQDSAKSSASGLRSLNSTPVVGVGDDQWSNADNFRMDMADWLENSASVMMSHEQMSNQQHAQTNRPHQQLMAVEALAASGPVLTPKTKALAKQRISKNSQQQRQPQPQRQPRAVAAVALNPSNSRGQHTRNFSGFMHSYGSLQQLQHQQQQSRSRSAVHRASASSLASVSQSASVQSDLPMSPSSGRNRQRQFGSYVHDFQQSPTHEAMSPLTVDLEKALMDLSSSLLMSSDSSSGSSTSTKDASYGFVPASAASSSASFPSTFPSVASALDMPVSDLFTSNAFAPPSRSVSSSGAQSVRRRAAGGRGGSASSGGSGGSGGSTSGATIATAVASAEARRLSGVVRGHRPHANSMFARLGMHAVTAAVVVRHPHHSLDESAAASHATSHAKVCSKRKLKSPGRKLKSPRLRA